MRHQGRITTWNDDNGFGFITPNGGGERVFVHISALSSRQRRPQGNELVTYECVTDGKGRAQAKAVAFVGERAVAPASSGRSALPAVFAIGFLAFVVLNCAALGWLLSPAGARTLQSVLGAA